MYRVGFPGWKIAARLGIPMSLRVDIHHDDEVNIYWTTSPDLGSLIVEGKTLDDLWKEVQLAAPDLIELELGRPAPKTFTQFNMSDDLLHA